MAWAWAPSLSRVHLSQTPLPYGQSRKVSAGDILSALCFHCSPSCEGAWSLPSVVMLTAGNEEYWTSEHFKPVIFGLGSSACNSIRKCESLHVSPSDCILGNLSYTSNTKYRKNAHPKTWRQLSRIILKFDHQGNRLVFNSTSFRWHTITR